MNWLSKKQPEKTFKATAFGHYTIGLGGCRTVYINLYEHSDGSRSYVEHLGEELNHAPSNAVFSVKAEVEAWKYQGNLPRCLFNPFDRFPLEAVE